MRNKSPRGRQARPAPLTTVEYLQRIGVPKMPPRSSPFDPGYDPATLESHLAQSAHLISVLKVSMACWIVADERATRAKLAAARRHRVKTVTGGGPFDEGSLGPARWARSFGGVGEGAHVAVDDPVPTVGFAAASAGRVLGGAWRTPARAVGLTGPARATGTGR